MVVVHPDPATACVAVTGELDTFNVGHLGARVTRLLFDSRPTLIQLNLDGLDFMDAAAARELRQLYHTAAQAGCLLSISGAPESIWWLINIMGLSGIFRPPPRYRFQSEPGS